MADSETQQSVNSSQQVASKTPATWPKQKNPQCVAAGKAIAEKRKQARKAQIIIANNQLKQAAAIDTPHVANTPAAGPPPSGPPVESESTKNVLTTTQWPSVISILVSLAGIYYKREEEIKSLLTKKLPVDTLTRAPPPSPVDTVPRASTLAPKRKVFIFFCNNGAEI